METLHIDGLADAGAGDVVRAIVDQAGVSPKALGDVRVDDGRALTEVAPDVADRVVEALDGRRIGASRIQVRRLDRDERERDARLRSWSGRLSDLVELEREEEMRRHEREIRELSGREREERGRAMLGMTGRDEGTGLGGHLVRFWKTQRDTPLPDTEIRVGDLVMISRDDPLRDDNPTGTVAERTRYTLTVVLDRRPPDHVLGAGLRIDLYVNDITYQRMLAAIETLVSEPGPAEPVRERIAGLAGIEEPSPETIDTWNDPDLDRAQKRAVRHAVGADHVALVHGPPGTGKTTTLVETIHQLVARDDHVLATAASNVAVDNLVDRLAVAGLDVVRVGHPARVTPALREHTLDRIAEDDPTWQRAQELREEAFDAKDAQEDLTKPVGKWRRGMSDDRIRTLAEQGRGARGVPADRIREMAEWLDLETTAEDRFARSDRLEEEAIERILDDADVVCTTNSTAGSRLVDGVAFDVAVVDEATQATEPSCLIPVQHVPKVVLAGDHRQLPPTVISREAERGGLSRSLFERLEEDRDAPAAMLTVQHRMHGTIMDFPSRRFYEGRLEADPSVRTHTLADLGLDAAPDPLGALDPDRPAVFLDTQDLDAAERQRRGSSSRENPTEAAMVAELAEAAVDAGVDPADVAVISPYDDQVGRIRQRVPHGDLEVRTVDGFQGREKEVVLLSLVRSNGRGVVGFLSDLRRLNVAWTRARRKIVVVGDGATVSTEPTYEALIDHVRKAGGYARLSPADPVVRDL